MAKLTFLVEQLELGGAETVALNLADEGLSHGFEVDVVAIKSGGLLQQRLPAGAGHVVLGSARTASALLSLRRYLRKMRPDALISFTDHVNILALLAATGTRMKKCATVHSPYDYTVQTWPQPKRWFAKKLIPLLYRRATAVVCVSQGVERSYAALASGRASSNVMVIPNPTIARDPIVRRAVVSRDPPYRFFFVGRLAPEKDLETLLGAFSLVTSEIEAELVFFGAGQERPALERSVAARGLSERVRFRGFESDMDAIYGSGDCLVLCSRNESFGNVLIEALSYGCRVVSTDCPVGPREVLEDGRWGSLVPVGDIQALARAMLATARGEIALDFPALARYLKRFSRAEVFAAYMRALAINPFPAGLGRG